MCVLHPIGWCWTKEFDWAARLQSHRRHVALLCAAENRTTCLRWQNVCGTLSPARRAAPRTPKNAKKGPKKAKKNVKFALCEDSRGVV